MDELRALALEVAHRILAGTDAERYELGVDNTKSASVGNLVELARQLLMEEGVGRAVAHLRRGHRLCSRPQRLRSSAREAIGAGPVGLLGAQSDTPLWIGEFGTCQEPDCLDSSDPTQEGFWFRNFIRFLRETDLDWCYWPLNGTQLSGHTRKFGDPETYGVLNRAYEGPASEEMLRLLQTVQGSANVHQPLP